MHEHDYSQCVPLLTKYEYYDVLVTRCGCGAFQANLREYEVDGFYRAGLITL